MAKNDIATGLFKNVATGETFDTSQEEPSTLGQLEERGFNVPIKKEEVVADPTREEQTGGVSSVLDNIQFPTSGITTSDAFTDGEDLATRLASAEESARLAETRRQAEARTTAEAGIAGQFDPAIEELTEFRGEQEAATRGRFGLQRRLSTAGEAFVGQQKERITKQITDLEKRKEDAVAALDTRSANAITEAIATARKNEIDLIKLEQTASSEKLKQLNTLMGLQLDVAAEERLGERLDFDVEKFNIGEARAERTADLAERKFQRDVTESERTTALENIKNMANSGILLEGIDDETITELEIRAGLESGTFEAFYSQLEFERAKGDLLDNLKIEKAKADIANIRSTIAKRARGEVGEVGITTGFKDAKIESSVREDAVSLSTEIEAGDLTPEQAFTRMRTLYSGAEVTDDALLGVLNQALGIKPAGEEDLAAGEISDVEVDETASTFGKGNFAEESLQDRMNTLKSLDYDGIALQNKLIKDGYQEDVVKRNVGTGVFEVGEFFSDLFNKFIQ